MEEKKQLLRLSNIELLRIISMLMVITLHFLGRGGVKENATLFSSTWLIATIWDGISIVCVNIYVLISGYFLVNSKFKIKKLLDLILQVFTYSFILYIVFVLIGKNTFSIAAFIKSFFPILSYQYWFASAYVGMYILAPFVNKGLHAMTKKEHGTLCIVLILLFTLYLPSKALGQNGYGIVWMLTLYIIGAYLRMYYTPKKLKTAHVIEYIIVTALIPLSAIVITYFSKFMPGLLVYSSWFYKNNSIPVLFSSVMLFVIFLNITITNNYITGAICFISRLTFGVYLFHNNPTLRDHLWSYLNLSSFMNNWWFVFAGIGIIVVIFIISATIEYLRAILYNKTVGQLISEKTIEKCIDSCKKTLHCLYRGKK